MGEELRIGRPPVVVTLTEDQKAKILEMSAEGEPVGEIRRALGLSTMLFHRALQNDLDFKIQYQDARREGLEELADQLITIPDTYEDVLRGRLKSENIRWLLSKRKADVYGDKFEVNVHTTVDIGTALAEAQSRTNLLPISYQQLQPHKQVSEIVHESADGTTGLQPVVPEVISDDDIFS